MGLNIEDGIGKGYQAKVNDENMLATYSIIDSKEAHTNIVHGASYNMLFSQTPSAAADCFLYIKNEDDHTMILEGIAANVATDEYIEVVLNDVGTPVGGTSVTPTNLNAGVNNVADGTFQTGPDITGLSGGNTAFRIFYEGGAATKYFNFDQDIIVPKNRILTLYCVTGSILIEGFLSFFFHEGYS